MQKCKTKSLNLACIIHNCDYYFCFKECSAYTFLLLLVSVLIIMYCYHCFNYWVIYLLGLIS